MARIINELHCAKSAPATIGLANFNSPDLDFIPRQLAKRVPTASFLNIDFTRNYTIPRESYVPILLHHFITPSSSKATVKSEVTKILHSFHLFGKEKKVIVLFEPAHMHSNQITALAKLYLQLGVIDIIYVKVMDSDLNIVAFNPAGTAFVPYHPNDTTDLLFPDRATNLSDRAYHVAYLEDPPFTFKSKGNKVVGSTVDFIAIIAKHQLTTVKYINSPTRILRLLAGDKMSLDFGTHQIVRTSAPADYTILQLSPMARWCIAVPKRYSRVLHEQVIWPFATDLWVLVGALVAFFACYQLALGDLIENWCPCVFHVVSSPLQLLKIMLLFLLSEYYTAMLTSNLGLSLLPAYPRTLAEFYRTKIPLIFPSSNHFANLDEQPQILSRIVDLNASQPYNPSKFALVQLCNRFRYSIGTTTKNYGKQASHHQFHLIAEPIRTLFSTYVWRLYEAGLWDYLVQKWTTIGASEWTISEDPSDTSPIMLKLDHFVPIFIIAGYLYVASFMIFAVEHVVYRIVFPRESSPVGLMLLSILARVITTTYQPGSNTVLLFNFKTSNLEYVPAQLQQTVPDVAFINYDASALANGAFSLSNLLLHIHSYIATANVTLDSIAQQQVKLFDALQLLGVAQKMIVVINRSVAKPNPVDTVFYMYKKHALVNSIFVVVNRTQLVVLRPDINFEKLVPFPITAPVDALFPDRTSNLSGSPYKVATYENPPMSYSSGGPRPVGSDVELIDIIAKHQSTTAIYNHTPLPVYEYVSWIDQSIHFATYRILYNAGVRYPFRPLLLPNMRTVCIVVPKQYSRVLHEQIIQPFKIDLWLLIGAFAAFFVGYHTALVPYLVRYYRFVYGLVKTPIQLFRILLLFLLTEYYLAMLTSNLGLSQAPTYPTTVQEFTRTSIPLLVLRNDLLPTLLESAELAGKVITRDDMQRYRVEQVAFLHRCHLSVYGIRMKTKMLGKETSAHHYHLIDEVVSGKITMIPFKNMNPRFERFQLYVTRLYESGVWNYVMKKWNMLAANETNFKNEQDTGALILNLEHFVPVFIVAGYCCSVAVAMLVSFLVRAILELHNNSSIPSTVGLANFNAHRLNYVPAQLMQRASMTTFLNIDTSQNSSMPRAPIHTPILVHAFSTGESRAPEQTIQTEVLNTLETFGLIGREKKIIVVLDPYVVKPTELDSLAKTYLYFGALDIIYVLVKVDELVIVRLNDMATEFVEHSTTDRAEELFPDRLTNLTGRPYRVLYLQNPPLSFRSISTNKTIGIDVDFFDMIAHHQHTVVEYRYTDKPIKPFDPWHNTTVDFANYRIVLKAPRQEFALLFLPNQYRWCLAVPKTYNRILHQQILWPYAADVWLLIAVMFVGFLLYNLFLKRALQHRFPVAFPIVNTPLHILRILLLFLLTEYYTALLSSNLGLSLLPAYPRTFEQFQKSGVPIIVIRPESYHFIRNSPEMMARTVRWNLSDRYNPAGFAVLQLCDLFSYTIRSTTRLLGKELNRHHYHLIEQPVQSSICMSPFRRSSPLLSRFQMYVRRLYEAGIWNHLVDKWTWDPLDVVDAGNAMPDVSMLGLEHFVPVYIVGGYLYLIAIGIFLLEESPQVPLLNTQILIHAVASFGWIKHKLSIVQDSLELLQRFGLYGKSKKVIVLVDLHEVKLTEFEVLKQSYHHGGAIDILYLLERSKKVSFMIPAMNRPTKLLYRSSRDSTASLFPDRLSNLNGQPYRVACIENRPLTFRADTSDRIIGIDVDFIDIIAHHQNTYAQYKYTRNPIKLFESVYDTTYDLATYRIKHEGLTYPFTPLYFPNQFRWCLAVPKTYNRVIHEQVIWPYKPSLWTLLLSVAGFFLAYRLVLRQQIEHRLPNAFPIINTPLQILRIMLLFLLTEYYTAKLTAILGLSVIPMYPKTLTEFANSPTPLLISHSSDYQYLLDNPDVYSKTIEWNFSKQYDPTGLALLQLCDLFPFTIDDTTAHLGKRLTYHHYHLIEEPISTSICLSPFRKTSPRLERFQMYVTRLHEAGIWNHLVSKWMLKDGHVLPDFKVQERKSFKSSILELEHFIPVYVIAGYLHTIALIIFILEHVVFRLQRRFQ
uniref:Uncharacterized protein n=1 Tax=Anopheles stephensi TaxID=30069 RepID=A0A182YPC1_ANOST